MYRIIGTDQNEYGPVSTDHIRQWLAQGRVNRQTRIKPEGATDWRTLGELPEFATDVQMAVTGGPARAETSGMAIASLISELASKRPVSAKECWRGRAGVVCAGFMCYYTVQLRGRILTGK